MPRLSFLRKTERSDQRCGERKQKRFAHAQEPQLEVTSAIVVDVDTNAVVLAMTKAMRLTTPGEGGGRIILSQIVIETEGVSGRSDSMLRLSIDKQLIAQNLTVAQAQFLIEEILDRIPVAEVRNARGP
jgi:hypothetical protein